MKKIVLFLILFFSLKTYSQNTVSKDSVIYLKEVVVSSKKGKGKIVKVKTKGEELSTDVLESSEEEVSLISNLPEGHLLSVRFWFNCGLINLAKKALGINYKDTRLALVIYEVGIDNKPGKVISDREIVFTVKKNKRGSIELDISKLNIKSSNKIFIGLARMDKKNGRDVVVKIDKNEHGISYYNPNGKDKWEHVWMHRQIKMTVKVKVNSSK